MLGIAIGYAIAPAISWPLSLWWLSRRSGVPVRGLILGAFRIIGVTALVAGATWLGSDLSSALPPFASMVIAVAAGIAVGGGISMLIPSVRRDVRSVTDVLTRIVASRRRSVHSPA